MWFIVLDPDGSVTEKKGSIKRIVMLVFLLILVISIILIGSSVYRLIIGHNLLVDALEIRGGYRSNSVDPKPYLNKAQLDIPNTLMYYLAHPLTADFRLIYIKRGYTVCRATLKSKNGFWYLEIPDETRWPKKAKPTPIPTPTSE
ncbi:hypothetical protein JXQ70_13725 [bacterium]|nr:hypothetical protein [bacterium]